MKCGSSKAFKNSKADFSCQDYIESEEGVLNKL